MKTIIIPFILLLSLFLLSCSEKTTQPYSDTVSTPFLSQESGTYLESQKYSIHCETPDITIRYTTDGTAPNTHSKVYSEPFVIETSSLVKAVAYKRKWNHSAVTTAFYEVYHTSWSEISDITRMIANPDTIYADNGVSYSTISVTVKDSEQFGIPGQLVVFQATMGNIVSSAITDDYGIATAIFKAEDETGVAKIIAKVRKYHPEHPNLLLYSDTDSLLVAIQETPPETPSVHTIQFTHSGQIDLNIINTGGVSSALLAVRLLDENSNLVTEPQNVWFKIINSSLPTGVNLDNHDSEDSVLAISANGIAKVTINSGTESGIVTVKASCTSGRNYIQAYKPDVFIHAAPPHTIVAFASGYNTGENVYGGLWKIVVGASVTDINDNPVDYGTSVWFYLPDNPYNCQIQATAYVGNESVTGDSTAGIAYTTLIYSGVYTFESLKIRAVTGGINGQEVFVEQYIVLPLNQPQLELEIIPGNLVFHGNYNPVPASATAMLNFSVFDIQGCPIRTVRINLTSTRGVFEPIHGTNEDPQNCNPYSQPNVVVTDGYDPVAIYEYYYDQMWQIPGGPDIADGEQGLAQGSIRFYAWEIPLADPTINTPASTAATITARILGTNISMTGTFFLIRYAT